MRPDTGQDIFLKFGRILDRTCCLVHLYRKRIKFGPFLFYIYLNRPGPVPTLTATLRCGGRRSLSAETGDVYPHGEDRVGVCVQIHGQGELHIAALCEMHPRGFHLVKQRLHCGQRHVEGEATDLQSNHNTQFRWAALFCPKPQPPHHHQNFQFKCDFPKKSD